MNTGTPASNPGAPRYFQRTGPRAPRGRGYARLVSNGRPAGPHTATGLVGSRPAVWLAMAAMLAIVIALAMLQGAAPAQAQTATVLVKNTGQSDDGADISLASSFPKQAQAFRTGSNSEGYNLTSIAIRFDNIASTSTVSI